MFIQPIDYFLAVWFALALASTLYVAIDQFRNNPEPVVMKWGFILVTLHTGPLGLLLYVLADKEPRSGVPVADDRERRDEPELGLGDRQRLTAAEDSAVSHGQPGSAELRCACPAL